MTLGLRCKSWFRNKLRLWGYWDGISVFCVGEGHEFWSIRGGMLLSEYLYSPPKFIYLILLPKVTLLGCGAFERPLGHDSRVLTSGISVLNKRAPKESPLPWDHTPQRQPSMNLEVGCQRIWKLPAPWSCISQPPGMCKINFSFL